MLRDGAGNGLSERPRSSTRIGKHSSPLQRIQIVPKLPDELREARFPTDRATWHPDAPQIVAGGGTTGLDHRQGSVIHRNHLQVCWCGFNQVEQEKKQLLLSQLTAIPKGKDINEIAAGIRNWRRHYGRAQEVDATLPDGVLGP